MIQNSFSSDPDSNQTDAYKAIILHWSSIKWFFNRQCHRTDGHNANIRRPTTKPSKPKQHTLWLHDLYLTLLPRQYLPPCSGLCSKGEFTAKFISESIVLLLYLVIYFNTPWQSRCAVNSFDWFLHFERDMLIHCLKLCKQMTRGHLWLMKTKLIASNSLRIVAKSDGFLNAPSAGPGTIAVGLPLTPLAVPTLESDSPRALSILTALQVTMKLASRFKKKQNKLRFWHRN